MFEDDTDGSVTRVGAEDEKAVGVGTKNSKFAASATFKGSKAPIPPDFMSALF